MSLLISSFLGVCYLRSFLLVSITLIASFFFFLPETRITLVLLTLLALPRLSLKSPVMRILMKTWYDNESVDNIMRECTSVQLLHELADHSTVIFCIVVAFT